MQYDGEYHRNKCSTLQGLDLQYLRDSDFEFGICRIPIFDVCENLIFDICMTVLQCLEG